MTSVAQALAQSRPARSGRDTEARWLNAAARVLHGREASSRRWINDDVQTRVLICERVDATARVPIGWPTPMRRLGTLLAVAMLVSPAAVAAATHSPQAHSPEPEPGKWRLEPDAVHNGRFLVIKKVKVVRVHGKHHKKVQEFVKDLTYIDDGQLDGGCAGTVVVPGPVPITPWHSSYGEYWKVGSLKNMQSNFPTEIHVTATLNGKPLSNMTIAMLFSSPTTDGPSKTQGHLEALSNAVGKNTCSVVPYFEHR